MADIGDKLKSAREAKGLSIGDIEKATKIQSRYLTAIEKNEFDKLPGDFYVRAFIRQYAQVVGLDGKELLSDYHEDVPEADPDEYVENSIDNKSEEVRQTTDNKKNLWKNYLPRIAIALGVIIVILVVYALYAHIASGGQHNQADNNSVTVSSQKSSSSSSKKPKKKIAVNPVKVKKISDNEYRVTGLKKNRKLVVRAGSTQNISASVIANNVSVWSSTLLAKQKHTVNLSANVERVVVTLGNDNGTSITIAGKKIPYAPNNAYRTITLLIGKAKKSTTHSDHSNDSTGTTTNNGNTGNNDNKTGSTTQSRTQSSTTRNKTTTQSSQKQSSTTTQSSQTHQSSQTQQSSSAQQSSTTTQNNNNGGGNDSGNNDNGN